MIEPIEIVSGDAPVCVDGVCWPVGQQGAEVDSQSEAVGLQGAELDLEDETVEPRSDVEGATNAASVEQL